MNKIVLNIFTVLLIVGYLGHALNFQIISVPKMCVAMILFAAAMFYLFV